MIRILGTILAGLLGLAFGSFLNVCLSRWPEGESVVKPRSHCRNCGRTLTWWENVPLVSWIALRGRCRTCKVGISWRYPLVEFVISALWAFAFWSSTSDIFAGLLGTAPEPHFNPMYLIPILGRMLLLWLLVALAVLDAENLWLPNVLTFPGIAIGLAYTTALEFLVDHFDTGVRPLRGFLHAVLAASIAAGIILLIRWTYWLIRRREGIGLGDAKLMALLGAWLGLSGALLSFAIGILLGAVFALVILAAPVARRESETWLLSKLPLGTFLCIGGIISALWGQPIIAAYLGWVGLR
jgi:leader peptidase (prepilin peptidase) / N-methyltransferase